MVVAELGEMTRNWESARYLWQTVDIRDVSAGEQLSTLAHISWHSMACSLCNDRNHCHMTRREVPGMWYYIRQMIHVGSEQREAYRSAASGNSH